jgi:hypothetical protein
MDFLLDKGPSKALLVCGMSPLKVFPCLFQWQGSDKTHHDHITVRYPLHIANIQQQLFPCPSCDVVQVQPTAVVTKQEMCAFLVQLQPVDLLVVLDLHVPRLDHS